MARLVKKTAHAPQMVGDKLICMCGLSKDQPFCDKSHLHTVKEVDGKLYWYKDGVAEEVETIENECCDEDCESECCDDCGGECTGGCSEDGCCGGNCCQEEETEKLKKDK